MKALLQRVTSSSVSVGGETVGKIGKGITVLLGVVPEDTQKDIDWLAEKVVNLRIFDDGEGKMNLSVKDVGGEILVISQFTLCGDCRKGRRPSWAKAAPPATTAPSTPPSAPSPVPCWKISPSRAARPCW